MRGGEGSAAAMMGTSVRAAGARAREKSAYFSDEEEMGEEGQLGQQRGGEQGEEDLVEVLGAGGGMGVGGDSLESGDLVLLEESGCGGSSVSAVGVHAGAIEFPRARNVLWARQTAGPHVFSTPKEVLPAVVVRQADARALHAAVRKRERVCASFPMQPMDSLPEHRARVVTILMDRAPQHALICRLTAVGVQADPTAAMMVPVTRGGGSGSTDFGAAHTREWLRAAVADMQQGAYFQPFSYFPVRCLCNVDDADRIAARFETVFPDMSLRVSPLQPLPVLATPFATQLLLRSAAAGENGKHGATAATNNYAHLPYMGFLTLDRSRKLVALQESEPLARSSPLVGVWVAGLGADDLLHRHPAAWTACVRYLIHAGPSTRVATKDGSFLLASFQGGQVVCSEIMAFTSSGENGTPAVLHPESCNHPSVPELPLRCWDCTTDVTFAPTAASAGPDAPEKEEECTSVVGRFKPVCNPTHVRIFLDALEQVDGAALSASGAPAPTTSNAPANHGWGSALAAAAAAAAARSPASAPAQAQAQAQAPASPASSGSMLVEDTLPTIASTPSNAERPAYSLEEADDRFSAAFVAGVAEFPQATVPSHGGGLEQMVGIHTTVPTSPALDPQPQVQQQDESVNLTQVLLVQQQQLIQLQQHVLRLEQLLQKYVPREELQAIAGESPGMESAHGMQAATVGADEESKQVVNVATAAAPTAAAHTAPSQQRQETAAPDVDTDEADNMSLSLSKSSSNEQEEEHGPANRNDTAAAPTHGRSAREDTGSGDVQEAEIAALLAGGDFDMEQSAAMDKESETILRIEAKYLARASRDRENRDGSSITSNASGTGNSSTSGMEDVESKCGASAGVHPPPSSSPAPAPTPTHDENSQPESSVAAAAAAGRGNYLDASVIRRLPKLS